MGERIRKSNSWELPWIIWSAVLAASGLMTGLLVNHGSGQGLLDHLLECVDDIFLLSLLLASVCATSEQHDQRGLPNYQRP